MYPLRKCDTTPSFSLKSDLIIHAWNTVLTSLACRKYSSPRTHIHRIHDRPVKALHVCGVCELLDDKNNNNGELLSH